MQQTVNFLTATALLARRWPTKIPYISMLLVLETIAMQKAIEHTTCLFPVYSWSIATVISIRNLPSKTIEKDLLWNC